MGAALAVELWKQGGNQGLQYTKYIKIKNIRDSFDFKVKKWLDTTHAKRTLGNRLYTLKGRKEHKELSETVISFIVENCLLMPLFKILVIQMALEST